MKFNKWTLGLAAVGAVSLASVTTAKADENNWSDNLSISGAVDTSIEWALQPSGERWVNSPGNFSAFRAGKQDGFNLNVVELNIEKPLDEAPYASGFKVQLWAGPDAVAYNPSANSTGGQFDPNGLFGGSDFAIKQAYVALRTPVGNGIDWKVGVFDTIIGYEVGESWLNPNFTRSWAYTIEPTEHTGVLASYKFNDMFSASFGVANTLSSGINSRNSAGTALGDRFWCKTWMASVAMTAPDSWGAMAGSTFYAGIVDGFDNLAFTAGGANQRMNVYAGAVLKTPVEGLTAGIAFDYATADTATFLNDVDVAVIGLYASYKATDKLSFHARGEYVTFDAGPFADDDGISLTGTVQYDLWANVLSRLEIRWDHVGNSGFLGAPIVENDSWLVAANIVYTF